MVAQWLTPCSQCRGPGFYPCSDLDPICHNYRSLVRQLRPGMAKEEKEVSEKEGGKGDGNGINFNGS